MKYEIQGGPSIPFQVMVKPVGPACNLACDYCFYLEKEKLYPEKSKQDYIMSDTILETFIKQYIKSQPTQQVDFIWQGGEPALAGFGFYEKVVEYQNKYKGDKKIENSFQTNGTLLTEKWAKFFKKHDFLVGISIDGPKKLHDYYRHYRSGKSTFDRVMNAIKLLNRYNVRYNILSVINNVNVEYPLEVYRFLKKLGTQFIQFTPIVERIARDEGPGGLNLVSNTFNGLAELAQWSVDPEKYGDFMTTIFDEWVRNDVGRYYMRLFDATLANWHGSNPGLCVYARECGKSLAMEHNGDVYSCDHFVYPENYLGNIWTQSLLKMAVSPYQEIFGRNKDVKLPEVCRKCQYRFLCHGGCPKNRIVDIEGDRNKLNYLCPGYKKFFSYTEPYMKFMVNELKNQRPPANVMEWAKQEKNKKA